MLLEVIRSVRRWLLSSVDICEFCGTLCDRFHTEHRRIVGNNFDIVPTVYVCECEVTSVLIPVKEYHDESYLEDSASSPARQGT